MKRHSTSAKKRVHVPAKPPQKRSRIARCRSSGTKTDEEERDLQTALHKQIYKLMQTPPFRRRDLISDSGMIKEGWSLSDVTLGDVKLYLQQVKAGASALRDIAGLHPDADARFTAQRALADVADIVLDEWPSKHQCVKHDPFGWLKAQAGSGLKQRWEQELHRRKEPKQTKFKPLDQARWSFINSVYGFLMHRHGAVVRVLAGLTATEEQIPDPVVAVISERWDRKRASKLVRQFLVNTPSFVAGLRSKTINPWYGIENVVVEHFDRYWSTVVEPLATQGAPSLWVDWRDRSIVSFAKSSMAWEIWAAWSKHAPTMKLMLLRYLRGRNPGAGHAFSHAVPFLVMRRVEQPNP